MRRLLFAAICAASAFAARPADASGCFIGPYALAYDPPADCAVSYYRRADEGDAPPRVVVDRGGVEVDVGSATLTGAATLDMPIYTVDCDGNVVSETHNTAAYNVFMVSLTGAQPGEHASIDWVPLGTVQPAGGACNAQPEPMPYCAGMYGSCETMPPPGDEVTPPPETDDTAGCRATSGASSVLVGFALAGCLARRRRRS